MKKVIAVICLLFTATAFAASFDCSKAGTPIERAICSYPELSSLDEQLASAYRAAASIAADPIQLEHDQRTWITQVRNTCESTNCLALAYQSRINDLAHSASTGRSDEKPKESGITSLQLKLLGLALLANAILSIRFHKAGKLLIYRDYTGAAFTGAAPLISIAIYFVLRFFEMSPDKAQITSIGVFAILMFFVVKSTARNNNGLSIFFAMSLITKVTIVGLYYAIMAALIFLSGSARKEGESNAAYEARKRRESEANAAAMVATTTAGFVALSAWVCKYSEFSPIEEHFSPNVIE